MSDDADAASSFEGFGDFGDFQSGDGELTPTGGSWTFASDASFGSGSDEAEVIIDEMSGEGINRSGSDSLSTSPTNSRGRIQARAQTSEFSDPHS